VKKLHLFEGFGVELEYMIVNSQTLKVMPIADELLKEVTGIITADYENGEIAWSNELVSHVIELKTNGPAKTLVGLSEKFAKNVNKINTLLEKFGATLLPTAAHPTMNPLIETKIWPHEYNEVYNLYNSIFDCKGHGWSNLQSTHINLPFANDLEFEKLHAAIRVLLPIIPALTASSPIIDSKFTSYKDTRLEYYRSNQNKIPSIAGLVIPEQVFSQEEYQKKIFDVIKKQVSPYDKSNIFDQYFLNSRGAIARFDRGAIEIRIIDIQECPAADLAILELIVLTLQLLISEKRNTIEKLKAWHEKELSEIFLQVIKFGDTTLIDNVNYLSLFGTLKSGSKAIDVWENIFNQVNSEMSSNGKIIVETILQNGCLSTRMLNYMKDDFSESNLNGLYFKLANCLKQNKIFLA
jgi:gamma-glutamyl:cysteine ligase YbdK (ATP-grasp superfamily)